MGINYKNPTKIKQDIPKVLLHQTRQKNYR